MKTITTSLAALFLSAAESFLILDDRICVQTLFAKGFGTGNSKKKPSKRRKQKPRLANTLAHAPKSAKSLNTPYVKSDQDMLLEDLASRASSTVVGRVVSNAPSVDDPFWELMPSLIASRFPKAGDDDLRRIAGFVTHTLNPDLPLEDSIVNHPHRRAEEIHAYMPGLADPMPFHDPLQLALCRELSENFDIIRGEYSALINDMESGGEDRFQSVTSMNYESGWKTLVLFYNGHRISGFPYHLCPVTTSILESVPLAGRIAGFNRQQPGTGIPLHTDGNNMWLTCQMGISVPPGGKATIRVGPETRAWSKGSCLLYDTTYEHETMNAHETEERVVLHVDFFNTIAMTPLEIEVMQYIYSLREEFMKAEGVAKVGAQIL